jgi:hypothetical protein
MWLSLRSTAFSSMEGALPYKLLSTMEVVKSNSKVGFNLALKTTKNPAVTAQVEIYTIEAIKVT